MDVIEGVRLLHYYTRGSIAVLLPDDRAVAPVDTPLAGRPLGGRHCAAYVDAGRQSCGVVSHSERFRSCCIASRLSFTQYVPVVGRNTMAINDCPERWSTH